LSTTFFTDRDLGKQFPALLRNAGISVEGHIDHFPDDAKDEDWIVEVGKRGWAVVTHDKRIRYKQNELAAVKAAGIAMFVLIGKAPHAALAQNFINTIDRVEAFVLKQRRPFIAKIYLPSASELKRKPKAKGRLELWVGSRAE
jgi:hypothetical protein